MPEDQADGALLTAPARPLRCDPHDFASLYTRHRSAFHLQARHYLRDARDADEVVQEAFLRLFLALPELETELQALAYCRRTITNLCIDRYRTQARRPSLVDIGSIPLEQLPDEDPGDPVVRAEDAALVREALSRLTPLHRAALVKREIEEKPLPVIAEELAVPQESVKHLLFRARRSLRRLVAGTSLVPGQEGPGSSGRLARAGPRGLAGLLLLLVLGLGSGPDLEAVPVVGVDLPAVLPVTELAETVTDVAVDAVDADVAVDAVDVPSAPRAPGRTSVEPAGSSADRGPLLRADSSASPTAAPPARPVAPAAAAPVRTAPAATPVSPAPDAPAPTERPRSAAVAGATPSAAPSVGTQEPTPTTAPLASGPPEPTEPPEPVEPPGPAAPAASGASPSTAPPSTEVAPPAAPSPELSAPAGDETVVGGRTPEGTGTP